MLRILRNVGSLSRSEQPRSARRSLGETSQKSFVYVVVAYDIRALHSEDATRSRWGRSRCGIAWNRPGLARARAHRCPPSIAWAKERCCSARRSLGRAWTQPTQPSSYMSSRRSYLPPLLLLLLPLGRRRCLSQPFAKNKIKNNNNKKINRRKSRRRRSGGSILVVWEVAPRQYWSVISMKKSGGCGASAFARRSRRRRRRRRWRKNKNLSCLSRIEWAPQHNKF